MGWELSISRWDGNGREIKRSGNKSGNKLGNKSGNKSGNTSGNTSACREAQKSFRGFHHNNCCFYVPCMCDSGIQGHTNGSTRTYVYIQQEQYDGNKCYGMCYRYIVIYETPYYVFLKNNFLWFVCERANKIILKAKSYGAGNSKFLKTETGWISDFGRTSASQQKIILWDSGN